MKLNRRQLRKLILRETRIISESSMKIDSNKLTAAIMAGGAVTAAMPGASIPMAMILGLIAGEKLVDAPKALYDGLNPDIKLALDGLVEAIKVLPSKYKKSLIESVVELINGATESIS
jgi:hypothetical protein